LAHIPQVAHTYQTIGFMNEHQVAIGETTFGGKEELTDSTGLIDYGSLMFLSIQRAKSAREAIKVIAELMNTYGYASSGESFSIGDANEVWIMELIGKGTEMKSDKKSKALVNANKGAVWVAMRVPEGYVSAHANHARITQFTLRDGKYSITDKDWDKLYSADIQVIYAHDVISFARQKGYFVGNDTDFSFSDTYNPLDFEAARFCELRVWSMFNHINKEMGQYWDYATGKDLSRRMPLFIKPDRKLTPRDLMSFKRDHLEGTELDMAKDIGAGPFGLPYRWRPLTWKYEEKEYFHERTTATQQTGFSYIVQMRNWLPDAIGGINWFGVDDASTTVYVPFYCSMTAVPHCFAEGNGDMLTYSETAAFWVFSRLAHFAYLFYDRVMPDVREVQDALESKFSADVASTDAEALALYKANPDDAIKFLTNYSTETANNTVETWRNLSNFLLVKYMDGNIKQEKEGKFLENEYGYPLSPKQPGYPESYKKQVVEENGARFLIP
jgi:dipeptidase